MNRVERNSHRPLRRQLLDILSHTILTLIYVIYIYISIYLMYEAVYDLIDVECVMMSDG